MVIESLTTDAQQTSSTTDEENPPTEIIITSTETMKTMKRRIVLPDGMSYSMLLVHWISTLADCNTLSLMSKRNWLQVKLKPAVPLSCQSLENVSSKPTVHLSPQLHNCR